MSRANFVVLVMLVSIIRKCISRVSRNSEIGVVPFSPEKWILGIPIVIIGLAMIKLEGRVMIS